MNYFTGVWGDFITAWANYHHVDEVNQFTNTYVPDDVQDF